jgi:hypothetical protein
MQKRGKLKGWEKREKLQFIMSNNSQKLKKLEKESF